MGLWAPLSAARRPRESTGGLFATHLLRVLSNRPDVMSELLRARVGRFADLVLLGRGNPVLLVPAICPELFRLSACPVASRTSLLKAFIVATNDLDRNKILFLAGLLRQL